MPGPATWREVFRVLGPGAHLLAFSGTRTADLMTVAIRMAGFEIRDCIRHEQSQTDDWVGYLFGTGFPKSADVSKAIDKRRTGDAEPVRRVCRTIRAAMDARGLKSRDLTAAFGNCHPRLIDHWAARDTDTQPTLPTWEQWLALRDLLNLPAALDAEVRRLNGGKGSPGDAWRGAEVIGEHTAPTFGLGNYRFTVKDATIRKPSKDAAAWKGWGTALKPAHEPIVVARKPLVGSVAENVLGFGTGTLNIDACRVEAERPTGWGGGAAGGGTWNGGNCGLGKRGAARPTEGRWPANVVTDGSDEVLEAFAALAKARAATGRATTAISNRSPRGATRRTSPTGMPTPAPPRGSSAAARRARATG